MGPDLRAGRIALPLTSFEVSVQRVQVVGESFTAQPDDRNADRSPCAVFDRNKFHRLPQSVFLEAAAQ
jgi:hypothetical protein